MLVKSVTLGSECEKVGVKQGDYVAMGTPAPIQRRSIKSMEIHHKLNPTTSGNQKELLQLLAFDQMQPV